MTKRDSQVDTSTYKNYQWVSEPQARVLDLENLKDNAFLTGFEKVVRRPETEPQLKSAVDKELQAKGFKLVQAAPDFYVTYYGKAKDDDWISTWTGAGVPSAGSVPLIMYPNYDQSAALRYVEGSLLLVFYDSKTKKPVWTGIMLDALSGKQVKLGTVTADLSQLVKEFKTSG